MAPARRQRSWRRDLLAFVGVSVVTAVAATASGAWYLRQTLNGIHRVDLPGLAPRGSSASDATASKHGSVPAMTILLVGNNTRTGLDPSEGFGTPDDVGGARSDVTMLLHLDPVNGASVLSIPRDLFVPLPAHSLSGPVGKIDAALNDGPENLVEAITNDLGIPIDHYVSVNFDGFQHVIDALNGIDMAFPVPLRDQNSGLNIMTTGCQRLNGPTALALVRARHLEYQQNGRWRSDPLSDLSRIRRDQMFLKVLANTFKAKGIASPVTGGDALSKLTKQLTVDSGMTNALILRIFDQYRVLDPETIPSLTLPVALINGYTSNRVSYGDVEFPSEPEDTLAVTAFLHGPLPHATPAQVAIVDRSGIAIAKRIGPTLATAGFTISSTTTAAPVAAQSETIVRYHPGEVDSARHVRESLAGAVLLAADNNAPPGTVIAELGSIVAPAAQPTASPSTTAPADTVSTPHTTTPTAGAQSVTPAELPPQSFDPVACR